MESGRNYMNVAAWTGSINVIMNNNETKPKEEKNIQKDLLGDEKVAELHVTNHFDFETDLIITLVYTKNNKQINLFSRKEKSSFLWGTILVSDGVQI